MADLGDDLRVYFDRLVDQAAVATGDPRAATRPDRGRRRASRLVVALVVVGALVVVVALVGRAQLAGDRSTPMRDVTPPVVTDVPVPDVPVACGDVLPGTPTLPEGLVGPIPGPAPDNPVPPRNAEQLVVHWTDSVTYVEWRWPSDEDGFPTVPQQPPDPNLGMGMALLGVQGPDGSGRFSQTSYYNSNTLPPGCQTISRRISSDDRAVIESMRLESIRLDVGVATP